jgi:hypothetical protein
VLQVLPIRDDDQQLSVICHMPGDCAKNVRHSNGWDMFQYIEQTDDIEGPVKANVGDITAVIADVVPPLRHCQWSWCEIYRHHLFTVGRHDHRRGANTAAQVENGVVCFDHTTRDVIHKLIARVIDSPLKDQLVRIAVVEAYDPFHH